MRITEKISNPHTKLDVTDISPTEKQKLYEMLESNGATSSFAYDRFFCKGFDEWELIGVEDLKRTFIHDHTEELSVAARHDDGTDLQQWENTLLNTPGAFYDALGTCIGLKKTFTDMLTSMGMCTTVAIKRFSKDDWKDFERVGVISICRKFDDELTV